MKYLLILLMILAIFRLKPLNLSQVENLIPKTIKVEVKGHVKNSGIFEIENYSTLNDLLLKLQLYEDSTYEHYGLNQPLLNNQIISINQKTALQKISINSASIEQLMTLKGVGVVMANRIIEYREKNGGYTKLEDLKNVKGIGEKVFENIIDFIIL